MGRESAAEHLHRFEGFFSGGNIIDREREIIYSTLSPPALFTAYDTAPAGAPPASPPTQFSADRIWPLYQPGWLRTDYHALHPSHYRKAPAFPDGAQNFLHEIQAYELFRDRAQHPNLPEYFGCVVDQGYVVDLIVKEYPRTLAQAVESGDLEHRDDIMAQLEDVIKYVHSCGIAHNDISPWNIVLTSDLRPILIDFDTARPVGTPLRGLDKLGTPGFRNGGKDLTLSAFSNDLYSLGAIARYMRDGVVIDEASVTVPDVDKADGGKCM
ncbi:hypothetical protein EXIGLDRAFT_761712 [Exidia glandulosa HHB12029]|uniref:Protein kinase domain-containing protein n=1 Tax=Exidia glandulosa HHB12029 TaxID=1314781 RepID=A0A166BEK4_EXIGL|nr:hypothetical protein EXIGLDRAFT_761712 [Exidia glandulosa HHB12029]